MAKTGSALRSPRLMPHVWVRSVRLGKANPDLGIHLTFYLSSLQSFAVIAFLSVSTVLVHLVLQSVATRGLSRLTPCWTASSPIMGLLQLPPEIQLLIAEYCHYQPRKRKNPWLGPLLPDGRPEEISGGLEWLSLVCKPLRSLVIPMMFTRLYIQCQPADLHVHLNHLRDNLEVLRVAR